MNTIENTYESAVKRALSGDLKGSIEILNRCIADSPGSHYNRFIKDVIENFDETLLEESIRKEDNRLLDSIPSALVQKFSKKFFKSEYVVRMGDTSSTFFIIAKGTILVTISGSGDEIPVALNYMSSGEFFGEMALFVGGKRTANVIVVSKSATLLEISRDQLEIFITRHPKFGMKMIGTLCRRLSKTNNILTELVQSGIYTAARDVLG